MPSTRIFRLPYARINEVRHLWNALFEHQLHLTPHLSRRARSMEQAWQHRLAIEAAWRLHEPRNFVIAAECHDTLVGYAYVRVIEGELAASWSISSPRAELSVLSVLPEERNAGVGRAIMERIYADVRVLGVTDLTVDVITTNIDAIRFYEREGAVPFHTSFVFSVPHV
jgi:GNAT superfamily N-acetyltransferase